ncbi:MAG: hypothetical protein ACYDD1_15820 [Caulobacteraceae bacterium]
MLTIAANTPDLVARLAAVPAAVQQALAAGPASPEDAKTAAVAALSRRGVARRLQPDRQAALARFAKPHADADPAALKQAAVQAALTALGRG